MKLGEIGTQMAGRCRVCGTQPDPPDQIRDLFLTPDMTPFCEALITLFDLRPRPTDSTTVVCCGCVRIVDQFYVYYLRVKSAQEYFCAEEREPEVTIEVPIKQEEPAASEKYQQESVEIKMDMDDMDSYKSSLDYHSDGTDNSDSEIDSPILPKRRPKRHKRQKSLKMVKKSKLRDHKVPDNVYEFPKELFKNGKLTIKGNILNELISKFYNIECDLCQDFPKFKSVEKMLKHYETEHDSQGYLVCCNSRLYHHRAIYMHMARHLQPSAFECPICQKVLSRPSSLKAHLQTHLPETEKDYKYSCDQCDKKFLVLETLNNHKITHLPVEERKKYDCKICGKIFTLPGSYYTHMRIMHSAVKFLCSECGCSFQRKTELTLHFMQKHDMIGENEIQCQHCGFMCKNKTTHRIHMKRHSVERLNCTLCDYTTHRQNQLNVHMRMKHSNEKPYACMVCEKQFKMKKVWKIHMSIHTGERKHVCKYCPKSFAAPGNYYAHMKKDHVEEYRNEVNLRNQTKFKEIVANDASAESLAEQSAQIESKVHQLAREHLQKIAEQNTKRKRAKQ